MSSGRLKYRIVKCTSEDPEYPASELLAHSSQTKGWQTARFCDFPQEMVLQFETPVHLRQVQFLSHQSKIATKIELFTALPAEGLTARYETLQFKRLGYLSLDSNERSQFQARELKSVYVDVSAQFLQIKFHKCHVNRYNIVNQVGLIALNCLGEHLGPDLAVGPPPPNPTLARGPEAARAQDEARGFGGPAGKAPPPSTTPQPAAAQPAPAQQQSAAQAARAEDEAKDAAQDASDEMRFDSRTMERIRSLNTAKARAVEAEDYEEAKRCKEMLARLRQTGLMLREMEERKRQAVSNEDYDAAKALKVEIDRLRMSIERPQAHGAPSNGGISRASPDPQAIEEAAPQGTANMSGSRNAPPPMSQAPCGSPVLGDPSEAWGPGPGEAMGRSPVPSPGGSQGPGYGMGGPADRGASPPGYHEPPAPAPFEGGGGPISREGAGSPLLPAQAAAKQHGGFEPGRVSPAAGRGGLGGPGAMPPSPAGGGGLPGGDAHPLAGVPNVEDLGQPDPIGASFEKEAGPLIDLFGEYVTRCIYSKTWNLRDAAIQKLTLDLRDGVYSDKHPGKLLEAFATILRRMIPDKNVQVFLSSAALLQTVCERLLSSGPIRRQEAQAALDPLMPLLVDRLGDPNARVDKSARDAHLDFARCSLVGPSFTAQYILRPLKKKVHARVYTSRLQLLTALVSEFGLQPARSDGLPLEPSVTLAMEWFSNPTADVRESAVKLVSACHQHVGLPGIEKYLANLRQAQREVFDAEFEKASGGGSAAPTPAARGGRGGGGYAQDGDDGLPNPQVPPRRAAAPPLDEGYDDDEEGGAPEFTCQFCNRQDPTFTPEALDVHYWRECPMLTQCEFCQQVIEIMTLRVHLAEECEGGAQARAAAASMPPNSCPLCKVSLGASEEQDWKEHMLKQGCPRNTRGGGSRGQARR